MRKFSNASDVLPYLDSLYGRKNVRELERYKEVLKQFKQIYGHTSAYLCSSSGRVEFVGNHTDHNGGRVLACTVSLDIVAAFCPNGTDVINIQGSNRRSISFSVRDLTKTPGCASLTKGVVAYLKGQGYHVAGFDAYTDSTIPVGAGVSSSAAFETVVGTILNELFNNGAIPIEQIAKAGQFAENEYFDKPCGLLDQSVVAVGGLVALDFADTLSYNRVQTDFSKINLVLINTGTSHANLSPLYASIPAEMKAVASYFGKQRLIEVDEQTFFANYDEVAKVVGVRPALRAKHFYEENHRVDEVQQALFVGDVNKVMELVNSSGDSSLYQLQNCAVNDSDTAIADIIKTARNICPCGARVHGGGFAGTVLCVVPTQYANHFVEQVCAIYGADKVLPLRLRSVGAIIM
ncbi:MAG: galactokinase [Clostridiales bacterium]|nr:galactokinase [Clostridiales bacterium]